jgi:hypothetical protein
LEISKQLLSLHQQKQTDMKKILLILAFITPLLTTLLAIIYTLNLEDRNEGVIVGLGILIIIATLEGIAYGVVLINCMFQKVERKAIENLEVSN